MQDAARWNVRKQALVEAATDLESEMINNMRTRRASAAIMVALGAVLMIMAPEIWAGLLLLILGVVLELAGIALGHKANKEAS